MEGSPCGTRGRGRTTTRRATTASAREYEPSLLLEPEQTLLVRVLADALARNPAQIARLLAPHGWIFGRRDERVADVVMEVRGLAGTGGDLVDVDVERERHRLGRERPKPGQAGLLVRLAQCHRVWIGLAVRVPSELEPAAELGVVRQEDGAMVGREHPCRSGDVALETAALEAIGVRAHELPDAVDAVALSRVDDLVAVEDLEEERAVHSRRVACRGSGGKGVRPKGPREDRAGKGLRALASVRAMEIRAVIFDLGGVIVGSPLHAIAQYERDKGFVAGCINRVVVDTGPTGAWSRLERGELHLDAFYVAFDSDCASVGPTFSAREMMERISTSVAPRPQMLHAVRRIRERGLKVAALTNNWVTDAPAERALRSLFDAFVESSVVGLRKPDPRIYEIACAELGVAPPDAVFLDDIGRNLKAARELGMTTIKVDDPDEALRELEGVLGFRLSEGAAA